MYGKASELKYVKRATLGYFAKLQRLMYADLCFFLSAVTGERLTSSVALPV